MSEICGMISFFNSSHPDQFYRLFISLFIHVGLVASCLDVCVARLLSCIDALESLLSGSKINSGNILWR